MLELAKDLCPTAQALSRETIGADLVADIVNAVTSIPDGMASAMQAGLNAQDARCSGGVAAQKEGDSP